MGTITKCRFDSERSRSIVNDWLQFYIQEKASHFHPAQPVALCSLCLSAVLPVLPTLLEDII